MPSRNIASSLPPLYVSLRVRAPDRLAALRVAADQWNAGPMPGELRTWRAMRHATMASVADYGLSQGFNTDSRGEHVPVWYTFGIGHFREECYADEHSDAPRYVRDVSGFYTDSDGTGAMLRPIIAFISHVHGWIGGYEETDGGGRVWFHDMHDDAREAAIFAHGRAEWYAEREREHSDRQTAADTLREDIAAQCDELCLAYAARHSARVGDRARDRVEACIETIREKREELAALVAKGAE